MKRLVLSTLAIAAVSALAGCAPYDYRPDFGNDAVNLTGPVDRNLSYVNGGTVYVNNPVAAQFVSQQQPAQQAQVVAPGINVAPAQSVSASAIRPQAVGQVTVPQSRLSFASPNLATEGAASAVGQAPIQQNLTTVVPAAYANAGQPANLQTRRVGDVGLIVYSTLIDNTVATGAAQRSCAQISKTATAAAPTTVATGVKQMNFRCN